MDTVSLIIPCAGKSSRFSGKPKWLRTCPNGNLMIQECIKGLNLTNVEHIYITFLKEHYDRYCKKYKIENGDGIEINCDGDEILKMPDGSLTTVYHYMKNSNNMVNEIMKKSKLQEVIE